MPVLIHATKKVTLSVGSPQYGKGEGGAAVWQKRCTPTSNPIVLLCVLCFTVHGGYT